MKNNDNRKVVLVGAGLVGTSYAYALLNQSLVNELVLIDINQNRAVGEVMDLNHGLAFSGNHMDIYTGTYADCADADIVALCAGVASKPGESRPSLLSRNREVFRAVVKPVMESGFGGIFLVASNPVDIMADLTHRLSGLPAHRVLGTGTSLDTARLRYLLGDYFSVDPRNVHAYVMGEHGDTEFVPWSQALIATQPIKRLCEDLSNGYCHADLGGIEREVRTAANKIIGAKGATYYGIGMAMVRITRAIFGNENSVLTVSALLDGEYGQEGVYAGVPCVVNRDGVQRIVELDLTGEELARFAQSCEALRRMQAELGGEPRG